MTGSGAPLERPPESDNPQERRPRSSVRRLFHIRREEPCAYSSVFCCLRRTCARSTRCWKPCGGTPSREGRWSRVENLHVAPRLRGRSDAGRGAPHRRGARGTRARWPEPRPRADRALRARHSLGGTRGAGPSSDASPGACGSCSTVWASPTMRSPSGRTSRLARDWRGPAPEDLGIPIPAGGGAPRPMKPVLFESARDERGAVRYRVVRARAPD